MIVTIKYDDLFFIGMDIRYFRSEKKVKGIPPFFYLSDYISKCFTMITMHSFFHLKQKISKYSTYFGSNTHFVLICTTFGYVLSDRA